MNVSNSNVLECYKDLKRYSKTDIYKLARYLKIPIDSVSDDDLRWFIAVKLMANSSQSRNSNIRQQAAMPPILLTPSIDEFLKYKCDHDQEKLYDKLILYRNMLGLYLCNASNVKIGGPLTVKVTSDNVGRVDWIETIIDKAAEKGIDLLIKPLSIRFPTSPGHAALVIYNIADRTFEYFDPNGYPDWYNPVLEAIKVYNRHFMKGYQENIFVCPFDPQYRAGSGSRSGGSGGTCSDWALFFLYMRCQYQQTYQQLKQLIISMSPPLLQKLIDGFRCYLWDTIMTTKMYELQIYFSRIKQMLDKEPVQLYSIKQFIYELIAAKDIPAAIDFAKTVLEPLYIREPFKKEVDQDLIVEELVL